MVGKYPFSASPDERREIKQVAKIIFSGGDALAFPETKEWMLKWNLYFNLFLQSVDRRTGSLLHLPSDGGLINQPSKTMTILMIMQEVYMQNLADSIKRK